MSARDGGILEVQEGPSTTDSPSGGPMRRRIGPGAGWGREREGMALAILLLLLLALTLLAQGILLLARRELSSSRSFLHALRAEKAALGAVTQGFDRLASHDTPPAPAPLTPLGSGWTTDGIWRKADARWLDSELFLLEGEGRSRGWGGRRLVGALGWRLDPGTRLQAFLGGVEVGGGVDAGVGAVLDGSDLGRCPGGWDPEECSAFGVCSGIPPMATSLPPVAALSVPDSLDPSPGGGVPGLGLLSGPELLDRAREAGVLLSDVRLDTGPMGCPDTDRSLFLASSSDLVIEGARVCGILLAERGLRLVGGGTFQGLALVGGDLFIGPGSTFEGMARVGGSVAVEDSGILRILACPVLRGLAGTPPLRKPVVVPGASLIHLR